MKTTDLTPELIISLYKKHADKVVPTSRSADFRKGSCCALGVYCLDKGFDMDRYPDSLSRTLSGPDGLEDWQDVIGYGMGFDRGLDEGAGGFPYPAFPGSQWQAGFDAGVAVRAAVEKGELGRVPVTTMFPEETT